MDVIIEGMLYGDMMIDASAGILECINLEIIERL